MTPIFTIDQIEAVEISETPTQIGSALVGRLKDGTPITVIIDDRGDDGPVAKKRRRAAARRVIALRVLELDALTSEGSS